MLNLESHAEGVLLCVRAAPGARRNGLAGEQNGALKVAVTQVAEKGKANQAIVDVVCKSLKLKKSQVELVSGVTSRDKRLLIRGLTAAELAERISAALTST